MQVTLNTKIELEIARALDLYKIKTDRAKNSIIQEGLLKVIPEQYLIEAGVVKEEIKKKYNF